MNTPTPQCDYDSGSMYGNRPLCDKPSTHRVTYRVPCYGSSTSYVCERHVTPTLGRLYPYETIVRELS